VLMSLGYNQTINYSFISLALHKLFFLQNAKIELLNPISADLSIMRSSLVLSLLKVLQYNQNRQIRANLSLKIFETGLKFIKQLDKIEQIPVIAGATYGRLFPKNWADSNQAIDFFDIKQDVVKLFKLGHLDGELEFKPTNDLQGMHPSKTALIFLNSEKVGFVGALHPEVINELDLKSEVFCFEVDLHAVQNAKPQMFKTFSKYPAVSRDMAILVDHNIPVSRIKALINEFCGILLKDIIIFDVFAGKNIPANKKSLALSLIFQDDQQTLNVEVVNELFKRLIDELTNSLGIELRQQ
jgi:phenylalanyl-tRNA synthetase beta chain